MSNVLFGYPIYSDPSPLYTPTFSGGSWVAALPLGNLATRYLHRVARSSTDAVADTLFSIDLGVNRAIRVLALVNHNLSSAGYLRFRGWTTLPFVEWTTVGSGFTALGTPTNSVAAFTCNDGVPMDLLGDDSAASIEGRFRTVAFTGDGVKTIAVRWKVGTSTSTMVRMQDTVGPTDRLRAFITNTAGVPSVTAAVGTYVGATLLETGVYRLVFLTSSVTAAATNDLQFYPACDAAFSVALTGDVHLGEVEAYDSATDPLIYNTGTVAALPAGTDAESRDGWTQTWTHVTSAAQTARYWRCNINDTTNPDTYVEIGRLIIAGGFQPTVNASYGATLGYADPHSTHDDADGGATIHGAKPRRRTCDLLCEVMSESEAFGTPFEMAQRLGTTGQLLFVFDPADTTYLHKRAFLATMRELSPIEFTHPTYHSIPFRLTEEL